MWYLFSRVMHFRMTRFSLSSRFGIDGVPELEAGQQLIKEL